MSDVINNLAVQFADQNRQDQRLMRIELQQLRHLLSAIVLQEGGDYRLWDMARIMARPDDELEFVVDVNNRCMWIRRPAKPPVVGPVVVASDRLLDWML